MMQADSLAQLRVIQLPEPISWWPLAPGWWVMIISVITLSIWIISRLVKWHSANRYRKEALQLISLIDKSQNFTSAQKLLLTLEILKQTVNSAYPEEHFSSLNLSAFLGFLQISCKAAVFQNLPNDLNARIYGRLDDQQYNNDLTGVFIASSKTWIKQHYPQKKLQGKASC